MPEYMFTGSFVVEGAKGVPAGAGSKRRTAVEQLFASVGGTLESYHFALGSDDFHIIGDLPGNEAAAAAALTTSAPGTVHTRTVVLLTPEELDGASKISTPYRAPGR